MIIQSKIGVINSSNRFIRSFSGNSLGFAASFPAGIRHKCASLPFCTTANSSASPRR